MLSLQTETQSASHSGPFLPESSSYLCGRQMSCLQWQGLERARHHSHSNFRSLCLSLCVRVHVCMCRLLLEYILCVCKSSASSAIVAYVNPRSFALFFIYPSPSTSCLALCTFAASSHLPWPWHWPSTINFPSKRSVGKCRNADHQQSRTITHTKKKQHNFYFSTVKYLYAGDTLVYNQLTSIPLKQVRFHFLPLVKP